MARPTNTQFALAVHMLTLLTADPQTMQSSDLLASSAGSNPVHVRSRPGPHGGWLPAETVAGTTLGDVWRAVNGDDPVLGLHSASPDCSVGQRIQAALASIDRRAAAALVAELEHTTIDDLVRSTDAADLPLSA
jgi:DNA-binding IscR family transcriptional regulator